MLGHHHVLQVKTSAGQQGSGKEHWCLGRQEESTALRLSSQQQEQCHQQSLHLRKVNASHYISCYISHLCNGSILPTWAALGQHSKGTHTPLRKAHKLLQQTSGG